MEAGNRCFDETVSEETNRRLVDHVADFNLAYTEHARRNLLAEGLHPRRIIVTGSPMREVLEEFRPQIEASEVLERLGLDDAGYFLVSAHREENIDSPQRLGPSGFHDYNHLQLHAACVLSDSGTISEESSILGFPAVTLRDSIERPEALDSGSIIMTGLNADDVVAAVGIAVGDGAVTSSLPAAYEIDDTSNRVVRFILSAASRHHAWARIRR